MDLSWLYPRQLLAVGPQTQVAVQSEWMQPVDEEVPSELALEQSEPEQLEILEAQSGEVPQMPVALKVLVQMPVVLPLVAERPDVEPQMPAVLLRAAP